MRNSTHYSTVEQQTTELFTRSKKSTWQNRSTTRCQATKLLLIFFGVVSVLSLTLCGFNNLVVDYTTTMPTNTTTVPTNTTTMPTNTTTASISATTVPEEETTLLSNLDYDDTTISTTTVPISTTTTTPEETTLLSDLDYELLRTPETRPGDVVIANKTIVINEVNNSLTVFD
jgi:hypothetical protein